MRKQWFIWCIDMPYPVGPFDGLAAALAWGGRKSARYLGRGLYAVYDTSYNPETQNYHGHETWIASKQRAEREGWPMDVLESPDDADYPTGMEGGA